MTASNVIPKVEIATPEGKLICLDLYTGEITNIDTRVDVQRVSSYSGLVYDGSYPPTYNVRGGILYASDVQPNDIEISTYDSTEPSDLKNTKDNIRKIKPDVNSKLKRV